MSTRSLPFLRPLLLLLGLAVAISSAPVLLAEGSPPLITDDPGTPGDGHWEINVGVSTERRPGARNSELPLLDINYGIGDRLQLKYEVPYLRVSEVGSPAESGLGNSELGVKWRFYDAGEKGFSVSVYPQLEFNNPGSTSDDKGLVEHGSVFKLPFQFEREVGELTLIGQVGREFRSDGDAWFYGLSVSHRFHEKVEVAVELAGGANAGLHRSQLTANLGVVIDLDERTSFMFSVGRELHNHDEPRATFVGYLGLQWRL
ncbi:MAG: transporter [Lacunisphaera sp.]|nr:transporter [Lacunisphaera sp.]